METQNFKGQRVGKGWQWRQQQGLAELGWGNYNTYTQRVTWHRLCQGKKWHRAIFDMLLACAMSLRSLTQTDKEPPSHLGGDVTPHFLYFAVLSPSGFVCISLPLPWAEETKDRLYQLGSEGNCCPTSHPQQFCCLISSFCSSDTPATTYCWEPKTSTQRHSLQRSTNAMFLELLFLVPFARKCSRDFRKPKSAICHQQHKRSWDLTQSFPLSCSSPTVVRGLERGSNSCMYWGNSFSLPMTQHQMANTNLARAALQGKLLHKLFPTKSSHGFLAMAVQYRLWTLLAGFGVVRHQNCIGVMRQ